MLVGVLVGVLVAMLVGVFDTARVAVAIGVLVGVKVAVLVDVFAGVLVGVFDGLAPPATVIINWGGLAPVRLEKLVAVLLVVAITKLYEPVPVTKDVTSTCVHVLAVILPEFPRALTKAGALEKLMAVSFQVPSVRYRA